MDLSPGSLIHVDGTDALTILHRIGTASLTNLEPGRTRATLFCDFRGRLLARALVARSADGTVWLARDGAPAAPLIALLEDAVFRENVRLTDVLGDREVVAAGDEDPPPGSLQEDGTFVEAVRGEDGPALVVRPASPRDAAREERERIAAARPAHGHEIVADFDPFEVGLAHEVHLAKGCYTGQEALQRMFTYRGVRRRLCIVRGDGAAPAVPAALVDGDRRGRLTSSVADGDGWIGLAVTSRDDAGGAALVLADGRRVHVERVVEMRGPQGVRG
jgi:folate-binding protein YgfZ